MCQVLRYSCNVNAAVAVAKIEAVNEYIRLL